MRVHVRKGQKKQTAAWPPLGACPARSAVFSITTTMLADSLHSPDRVVTASRNAI